MKSQGELKCPGCEFATKCVFKRPASDRATITQFICSTCMSSVSAQIRRGKGKLGIFYRTQILTPSPLLIEMKREEAEFNGDTAEI